MASVHDGSGVIAQTPVHAGMINPPKEGIILPLLQVIHTCTTSPTSSILQLWGNSTHRTRMLGVTSLDMDGSSGIPWGSFSELLLFHVGAADIKANLLEGGCSERIPSQFHQPSSTWL